ncbi:MAG: ABC transporter permease [Synergistota bacterium]|jgi:peptide/nickel transport system permease protein|nr:ABC transporter permease [Synergistota bacterium]
MNNLPLLTENQQDDLVFKKESVLVETWQRLKQNKLAMFGLITIFLMIVLAFCAELITPYANAITMNFKQKLLLPSGQHWFGTDNFGRDVFARCLYGSRVSLAVGFGTSIASLLIGSVVGSMAGFIGGRVDNLIMRFMDLFSSMPAILLAMAVVAALGSGLVNVGIAITIASIPTFVRVVRSSVLSIADQEFIEAARAGGTRTPRIIFRHVLPNAIGPLIVQSTMNVSQMIIMAAVLSFLGMGVDPPQPEWGALLSEAKEFLRTAPYLMFFPGALICLSSFSMNVLGDGLRDALDPRLRD